LRNLLRLAIAASVAAAVTVGFAGGASAAVTGSVTPSSGLHDGDTVHVVADGLPANTPIQVTECVHGATSSTQCDGNTTDVSVSSDPNGHYDNTNYSVYQLPGPTIPTSSIQCDDTHACDLYVGDDLNNLSSSNHILLPIAFAAASTTTTAAVTTTTAGGGVPANTAQSALPVAGVGVLALGGVVYAGRRRKASKSKSAS